MGSQLISVKIQHLKHPILEPLNAFPLSPRTVRLDRLPKKDGILPLNAVAKSQAQGWTDPRRTEFHRNRTSPLNSLRARPSHVRLDLPRNHATVKIQHLKVGQIAQTHFYQDSGGWGCPSDHSTESCKDSAPQGWTGCPRRTEYSHPTHCRQDSAA